MRCKPLGLCSNIDNRHRITNRMRRWGFKFLGAGDYSAVFQHPKDERLVIKYGPLDDGWLVFAAWCEAQRSANNPHLPVIHSIKRYERQGLYCAIMDKLDVTIAHAMCGDGPLPITTWDPPRRRFNYGVSPSSDWCAVDQQDWSDWLTDNKLSSLFEKTLARLMEFAIKHGLGRDLHGGNAMLRKHPDGTFDIVLTDPFSEGNGARFKAALIEAQQDQALAA